MKPKLLIACDFDGTLTRQDTLVTILDSFGSPSWREVQQKVVSGEIPIREGLAAEMASVRANREQLIELLTQQVGVDPAFSGFLHLTRREGVPLVCLTGGFDLCVETVLKKEGLWPLPYLANRLLKDNGSWHVEFPYPSATCAACGHCKADPIRGWNEQGYTTVFVGNGVTDRCPARVANLTFAKEELGQWCQSQGLPWVPYENFSDVEQELRRREWI
ncbi:MAG: MtnX-like HAD-IB family phosphatase [Candidatus Omnitrophica bacterium]|nr:MtnX-like HAD-IB family phosphatase [Candidatus Omnitrophota bacterium]